MGVQIVSAIKKDGVDGAYGISAVSGLLTTVAAATDSAGHLFAFRWAPATAAVAQRAVISRLRARWITIAGFTAAQEVGIDFAILRTYTAPHTGGTAVVPSQNRALFPATAVPANNIQIAGTGALTDGTHATIADLRGRDAFSELAAGAAVPKGTMQILKTTEDLDRSPIVLAPNEGLVIRNSILMGAGGTARLVVDLDWLEVAKYT